MSSSWSRPRLIALDLDGTTLDGNRQLPQRHIEAIARAREAGVCIVLASGRSVASMRPFLDRLKIVGPCICCNGGHGLGTDGEELWHHGLEPEVAKIVIGYARHHEVHVNIYSRDRLFYLWHSTWGEAYHRRVSSMPSELLDPERATSVPITKLMLVAAPDEIPRHRKAVADLIESRPVQITESEPEYLEFLAPRSTKGHGLAHLADHLGIRREEVAAMGDYLNDVEMLEWAGMSAAVANAHPETRAVAQRLFASNEEGGVADFIDSLLCDGGQ